MSEQLRKKIISQAKKNKQQGGVFLERKKQLTEYIDTVKKKGTDSQKKKLYSTEEKLASLDKVIEEFILDSQSSSSLDLVEFQQTLNSRLAKIETAQTKKSSFEEKSSQEQEKKNKKEERSREESTRKQKSRNNQGAKSSTSSDDDSERSESSDKVADAVEKANRKHMLRAEAKAASKEIKKSSGTFGLKRIFRQFKVKAFNSLQLKNPIRAKTNIQFYNEAIKDEIVYWETRKLIYERKLFTITIRLTRKAEIKFCEGNIKKLLKIIDFNNLQLLKIENGIINRVKDAAYGKFTKESKEEQKILSKEEQKILSKEEGKKPKNAKKAKTKPINKVKFKTDDDLSTSIAEQVEDIIEGDFTSQLIETDVILIDKISEVGQDKLAKEISTELKTSTDKNSKKLLVVNTKILDVLDQMREAAFDEQDTSIRKVSQKTGKDSLVNRTYDSELVEHNDSGIMSLITRALGKLGLGAAGLLGAGAAGSTAKKAMSKKPQKVPKVATPKVATPKVSALKSAGRVGKGAVRGGKAAIKAAKFLGPLGLAVTAGMSVYDSVQGWKNAGETFGVDDDEVTTTQKSSSAAGSFVSGITFGLVDSKNTSHGINNLLGGNAAIEKYSDLGIIDHDVIGDSEIDDWNKLRKLSQKEIQEIINIDDWDDKDLKKLQGAQYAAKIRELARPGPSREAMDTESGIGKFNKVNYNIQSPIRSTEGKQYSDPDSYMVTDLFRLHNTKEMDVNNLDKNVLSNLKAMAAEYYDIYGKKIQINSAFRSFAEQERLKEKYGDGAAAPGSSMHNYGLAVDMNTSDAENAINAGLFKKYGFTRPVPGETWHVEPAGINRRAIREGGMQAHSSANSTDNATTFVPEIQSSETELAPNETAVAKVSNIGAEPDINIPVDASPKSNKNARETIVSNTSNNLLQQTVVYENKNAVSSSTSSNNQANSVTALNINNINSGTNESRMLSAFSS